MSNQKRFYLTLVLIAVSSALVIEGLARIVHLVIVG